MCTCHFGTVEANVSLNLFFVVELIQFLASLSDYRWWQKEEKIDFSHGSIYYQFKGMSQPSHVFIDI